MASQTAGAFVVDSTKSGAPPIKVESRAKGKKVTLLSNVRGDAQLLCSTLTTLLGIGGSVQEEKGQRWIQLQGSQQERVLSALRELKCLRGVKEDEKTKKAKEKQVAARHCGYDKFLRQDSKPSLAKLLEGEAYAPKCPPGAECFRWHGHWVYCRGCCEQTDDLDVWEESGRFCDPSLEKPYSEEPQLVGAPMRPTSCGQLDDYLRKLGMLAEVGEAAVTWGLRDLQRPSAFGTTLAEYRRMAVGPKAKLLELETKRKKTKTKVQASTLQAPTRSKSQPVKVPQEEGCQHHFGLYKTLKGHMQLSHNQLAPPKSLVSFTPPKAKPSLGRTSSVPPKAAKSGSRWAQNGAQPKEDKLGDLEVFLPTPAPEAPAPPELFEPSESLSLQIEEFCEVCPICQKKISFKKLQEHVEECLMNPEATALWQECPGCHDKFHPDAIDEHCLSCLIREDEAEDESDAESDVSDGIAGHPIDLNGYPVVKVIKSFHPEMAAETQIMVVKDDFFLLLWQQPAEEQIQRPVSFTGYVPRSHLAVQKEDSPDAVAERPEVNDEIQPVRRWGRR